MHPIIAKIQAKGLKKVPEVKTGFTVRVSQKVTEGTKERIQNFEGLVIKVGHGAGVEKTFTVRKIVEGIGVEKVFPFHSPTITKIHVVKKAKVRREKLYYMRERFGKSARLTEKQVTDEERSTEEAKMEAMYAEAIKAEEEAKAKEAKTDEATEMTSQENDTAMTEAEEKTPENEVEKEDNGAESETKTEKEEVSKEVDTNSEEQPEEEKKA